MQNTDSCDSTDSIGHEIVAAIILLVLTVVLTGICRVVAILKKSDTKLPCLRIWAYGIGIVFWCSAWNAGCGQFTDWKNYFLNFMRFVLTLELVSILKYGVLLAEKDPGRVLN